MMSAISKKIQEQKAKMEIETSIKYKTVEKFSKMKFSGRIKNLSLWIP